MRQSAAVRTVSYDSVVPVLRDDLPELFVEFIEESDADFERDESTGELGPYFVIGQLAMWLNVLTEQPSHAPVFQRATEVVERIAEAAVADSPLFDLLGIELGEGFPFTRAVRDALGPITRGIIDGSIERPHEARS